MGRFRFCTLPLERLTRDDGDRLRLVASVSWSFLFAVRLRTIYYEAVGDLELVNSTDLE